MAFGQPSIYLDFSGGLHLDEGGTYLIEDSECQDCLNVTATDRGALKKRAGFLAMSSLSTAAPTQLLESAHTLFPVNLANESLLAVGPVSPGGASDRIVKVTTAGTASTLKSSLAAGARWEFAQGPESGTEGPIYGLNGVDDPQEYDGVSSMGDWSAHTADGTPITPGSPHPAKGCTILFYALDKFWATGDPAHPGRVWSTGVTPTGTPLPDPCNWDSDFIDDVDPADGQEMTGVNKVGPYVVFTKNRKTYVVSDAQGRAYRQISSTIGCCSNRSMVETEKGLIFLSEDVGVCITDGTEIRVISEKIAPLLREIADNNAVAIRNACATYHQGSYYLSLPRTSNENELILEYQVDAGSWWVHSAAASDFALLDPSGTPRLYSAAPGANRLDQAFAPNTWADNGAYYGSYWKGPFWVWGNPHVNKRINQLRADGRGSWDLFATERFGEDYEKLDYVILESPSESSDVFGGPGTFAPAVDDGHLFGPGLGINQRLYPTPLDGYGRAWSFLITDLEGNLGPMTFYSLGAFARDRTD